MRHDWIFDVLTDLRSYAQKHNLLALAAQVDETMRVARAEVAIDGAQVQHGADDGGSADATPAEGRRH